MSRTQELYSAAGSASKSESEGGIWTLDIFSHKKCEPQKYVNYTHIFACSFQRNSLHCSKKKYCPQKVGRAVAHVPADAYGMFLTALHAKMCGFINSVKIFNSS